jgi:hypothetical protein
VPKVLSYWSYVENQLHIWLYVYTGMVLIMKAWYNWNIVESGVKHHQTNKIEHTVHAGFFTTIYRGITESNRRYVS